MALQRRGVSRFKGIVIMKTSSVIPKGKIARSVVAGIFNRKSDAFDERVVREVHFIAHELLTADPQTPSDSFIMMERLGFDVVECRCSSRRHHRRYYETIFRPKEGSISV